VGGRCWLDPLFSTIVMLLENSPRKKLLENSPRKKLLENSSRKMVLENSRKKMVMENSPKKMLLKQSLKEIWPNTSIVIAPAGSGFPIPILASCNISGSFIYYCDGS